MGGHPLIFWQFVAYSGGNHWVNREVAKWSGYPITHVGVRFHGTDWGYPVDIYYDVKDEPEKLVTVLAIGIKDRNRVIIGGEEVEL